MKKALLIIIPLVILIGGLVGGGYYIYENEINHLTESLHSFELEINNKKNKLTMLNNDLDIIKSKISINEKEMGELEAEKIKVSENQKTLEQELEHIKNEISGLEKEIVILQEDLKVKKEQGQDFYDYITSLKIKEAELKQQISSFEQNIYRNDKTLEEYDLKIKEIFNEIDNAKNDLTALSTKSDKDFDDMETNLKQLQQDLNNIQNSMHRIEMQKVKVEMDIESLEFRLLDVYEMSYRKALELKIEGINLSKAAKKCDELKEEIRALGTINVNAVEEYENLSERHGFLKKQLEDLIRAKD